jgi:glycolate oxidase iron-sulfur subunit
MQSNDSSAQLADAALAEANAIINTCNHFGFCTATCPTYSISHDENESPRGRIDLIRAMLATPEAPDAATVKHLDTCLSCLACVTTCAAKVDYMHLIDHARAHIDRHYQRSWRDRLFRSLIAAAVPHRRRFRLAVRLGQRAAPLARFMPVRVGQLLELLPPPASPALPDLTAGTYPAQGATRWRVALLAGCAQRVLAPQINSATVRLLNRLGCEVSIVEDTECCGALALHMGRAAEGRKAAKRNINAWIAQSKHGALDAIIVNASGCGTMMKDYDHVFQDDVRYREHALLIASLTVDVCEFLDRIGLPPATVATNYRVAYHDACSLRNGQRITREPRRLLRRAGFHVIDVPEAHFCCGSAGAYNLLQPKIARYLGERKARHTESTGADVLALGNVGCLTQLTRFTPLPIVHTVELLDWATGGPIPPILEGKPLGQHECTDFNTEPLKGVNSPPQGAAGPGFW